jgi:flavin-dependent dehydrogenase
VTARALIVGGGPAGLAAAATLATWCDAVTVAEARPRDRLPRPGEHLPPAALSALAAAGLSALLRDERHDASPGVRSAWSGAGAVDKEYYATAPGRGLNLRREVFDEALAQRAAHAGAAVRFGTRLTRLDRDGDGYAARLVGPHGPGTLRVDVVVDASGRRAVAARKLGAIRRRNDALVGLVGRVRECEAGDEPGRVHIEAVEDGWWYGVVLSDGTLLAAFMTDVGLVRDYPGAAPGLWKERLEASALLRPLAHGGRWSGRLRAFDAATQSLELVPHPGFLAVGDAATAYDPLSSWGITKGICDGHAGADALARERRGERGALADHRAGRRREFQHHRARQREFYEAETRWAAAPFWRARTHGSPHSDPRREN